MEHYKNPYTDQMQSNHLHNRNVLNVKSHHVHVFLVPKMCVTAVYLYSTLPIIIVDSKPTNVYSSMSKLCRCVSVPCFRVMCCRSLNWCPFEEKKRIELDLDRIHLPLAKTARPPISWNHKICVTIRWWTRWPVPFDGYRFCWCWPQIRDFLASRKSIKQSHTCKHTRKHISSLVENDHTLNLNHTNTHTHIEPHVFHVLVWRGWYLGAIRQEGLSLYVCRTWW